MISQRLFIAALIANGSTFKEISDNTGASSSTIERVKQSFLYGKNGYKIVLEHMEKDKEMNAQFLMLFS